MGLPSGRPITLSSMGPRDRVLDLCLSAAVTDEWMTLAGLLLQLVNLSLPVTPHCSSAKSLSTSSRDSTL